MVSRTKPKHPGDGAVARDRHARHSIPQKSPIDIGHALENAPAGIEIVDRLPAADYADELKFNEDPVTVVINPSTDPKAAKVVFCAIDNKGASLGQRASAGCSSSGCRSTAC